MDQSAYHAMIEKYEERLRRAPQDVEAVEVYHGFELPAEFGVDACGGVLLWTRRGDPTARMPGYHVLVVGSRGHRACRGMDVVWRGEDVVFAWWGLDWPTRNGSPAFARGYTTL